MVIYFSATGNTEFIAREIASRIGDECLNLIDRIKNNDLSPLLSDRPWIICSPVYVCEMPRFFTAFLRDLPLEGCKDVYYVFTSGGYAGSSGPLGKSLMRRKGMIFRGYTEFVMPRNYPVSKKYDMLGKEQTEERLKNAYQRIDEVADIIRDGGKLPHRYVFFLEKVVTLPFNPVWCSKVFKADDFTVSDSCVGCGLCAKLCPLNNIMITDGKPSWGSTCTHCMACLGNCPKEAIEYGERTVNKGKYNLKRYKYYVDELKGK
ncbi:MAG: EFR1 family ferrodoxin [Clostridiales bacterium]|nr:EFR1 family ferrodoxin [Clostridiales bacterium]